MNAGNKWSYIFISIYLLLFDKATHKYQIFLYPLSYLYLANIFLLLSILLASFQCNCDIILKIDVETWN